MTWYGNTCKIDYIIYFSILKKKIKKGGKILVILRFLSFLAIRVKIKRNYGFLSFYAIFKLKYITWKKSGVNFKFIQINDYTEVKRFWGEKNLVIIEILQNRYQNTVIESEIWKMIFWTLYRAKLLEIPNFSHFLSKSKFKNKNNTAGISSLNSAFL